MWGNVWVAVGGECVYVCVGGDGWEVFPITSFITNAQNATIIHPADSKSTS